MVGTDRFSNHSMTVQLIKHVSTVEALKWSAPNGFGRRIEAQKTWNSATPRIDHGPLRALQKEATLACGCEVSSSQMIFQNVFDHFGPKNIMIALI